MAWQCLQRRTGDGDGELDADSMGSAEGIPPPPAGERDGDGDGELEAESIGRADGMPPPPAGEMDCTIAARGVGEGGRSMNACKHRAHLASKALRDQRVHRPRGLEAAGRLTGEGDSEADSMGSAEGMPPPPAGDSDCKGRKTSREASDVARNGSLSRSRLQELRKLRVNAPETGMAFRSGFARQTPAQAQLIESGDLYVSNVQRGTGDLTTCSRQHRTHCQGDEKHQQPREPGSKSSLQIFHFAEQCSSLRLAVRLGKPLQSCKARNRCSQLQNRMCIDFLHRFMF